MQKPFHRLALSLLGLSGLVHPGFVSAATLDVSLAAAQGSGALACEAPSLRLSPLDGGKEGGPPPQTLPARLGSRHLFEVEPGPWEVTLAAGGCWAPAKKVLVGPGGETSVSVRVWKEADILGRLAGPRQGAPRELRLTFSRSFADPRAEEPSGVVFCPVAKDLTFHCHPPAAALDLRISAEGFAPLYFWGVRPGAGAGALDLRTLRLVPGASLAGWLLTEEGEAPKPEEVSLTLVPAGLADAISLEDQFLRRFSREEAVPLENGFFQFDSLKAGEYFLLVRGESYGETRLPISLVEGRESELRDPVLLAPPLKASFVVDPPTAPGGTAWGLVLSRLHASGTYADTVLEAEIPPDGWYETPGLSPGTYLVKVVNGKGEGVASRRIELGKEPMPVTFDVGSVLVEGRVTLGKDPLAATIWFGGRHGAQKVETKSDEEGHYRATLPRAGLWRVEVSAEAVGVKDRKMPIVDVREPRAGRPATVDLAIPDTRLSGTVTGPNGGPPGQLVLVYTTWAGAEFSGAQRVGKDGRFELRGLDEGPVQVHAAAADESRSETVVVNLVDGGETEVHLTLRRAVEVTGVVVGESGPIPGAFIQLQVAQNPFLPIKRIRADGGGRFSIALPAETTLIYATVSALDRTLGVFAVPFEKGQEAVIRLPGSGGNLRLAIPDRAAIDEGRSLPVYFRDGIPFAFGEVEHWAYLVDRASQKPEALTIPNLVEGQYEVCNVPSGEYMAAILGRRPEGRCASGHLPTLGELALTLPADEKEAPAEH